MLTPPSPGAPPVVRAPKVGWGAVFGHQNERTNKSGHCALVVRWTRTCVSKSATTPSSEGGLDELERGIDACKVARDAEVVYALQGNEGRVR